MNSGQLNEKIEIYRKTLEKNRFGEEVETWEKVGSYRCNVLYNYGSKNNINDELTYIYTKIFTVRYYVDVQELDRILYNNKFYNILSIEPTDRHNFYKKIKGELLNE